MTHASRLARILAASTLLFATLALAAESQELTTLRERTRQIQSIILGKGCTERDPDCHRAQVEELTKLLGDYETSALNESHGDTKKLLKELSTVDDSFAIEETARLLGPSSREPGRPPFVYRRKTPVGDLVITVTRSRVAAWPFPPMWSLSRAFAKRAAGTFTLVQPETPSSGSPETTARCKCWKLRTLTNSGCSSVGKSLVLWGVWIGRMSTRLMVTASVNSGLQEITSRWRLPSLGMRYAPTIGGREFQRAYPSTRTILKSG